MIPLRHSGIPVAEDAVDEENVDRRKFKSSLSPFSVSWVRARDAEDSEAIIMGMSGGGCGGI